MRKLERPHSPASLLSTGVTEFNAAKNHFDGTGQQGGFEFRAYRKADVKDALEVMSGGKCAYCEADYDATQPKDVEHFRPKGAIQTTTGRIKPGYWWLAATWENLLPSCIRCNREENLFLFDGTKVASGKKDKFPLMDEALRASAIGQEACEVPLLINPCVEDPSFYIHFIDDGGSCIAVPMDPDPQSLSAQKARSSIDIYGLNRSGLVRDRTKYMRWAKVSLRRLEILARRLDLLPEDEDDQMAEIFGLIDLELGSLYDWTCGGDRYTGMLVAIIEPKLTELNLSL